MVRVVFLSGSSLQALQKVVEACVPDADIALADMCSCGLTMVDQGVPHGSAMFQVVSMCQVMLCEMGDKIMEEEQRT